MSSCAENASDQRRLGGRGASSLHRVADGLRVFVVEAEALSVGHYVRQRLTPDSSSRTSVVREIRSRSAASCVDRVRWWGATVTAWPAFIDSATWTRTSSIDSGSSTDFPSTSTSRPEVVADLREAGRQGVPYQLAVYAHVLSQPPHFAPFGVGMVDEEFFGQPGNGFTDPVSDRFSGQLEGFVGVVGFLASRNEPARHVCEVQQVQQSVADPGAVPPRHVGAGLSRRHALIRQSLAPSQRDGFADNRGVALIQGTVGDHVDVAAKEGFKLLDQSGLVQHVRFGLEGDQQVDVAVRSVFSPGDRAEHSNVARVISRRRSPDLAPIARKETEARGRAASSNRHSICADGVRLPLS